jgi:hypothetical protein
MFNSCLRRCPLSPLNQYLDGVGELAHKVGELFTIEGGRRTGHNVMDSKTRFHELGVADSQVVSAGVDVNLVAEPSQGARELADVDVHSPAVAGPRLGQGRRVVRENGESGHETSLPVGLLLTTGGFPSS